MLEYCLLSRVSNSSNTAGYRNRGLLLVNNGSDEYGLTTRWEITAFTEVTERLEDSYIVN